MMKRGNWQYYLRYADVWVACTLDRAIMWMHSGGTVRCS